jgi:hypothetical protein
MVAMEEPIVYINRTPGDWEPNRGWVDGLGWTASTGGTTDPNEEAEFATAQEAIDWGRERAQIVLVRLSGREEDCYSAGERKAHEYVDGSGYPYKLWPPEDWVE